MVQYVHEMVLALESRGTLGELFDPLVRERPNREQEIRDMEARWKAATSG